MEQVKEIKLKKDGQTLTPLTLIESIRNLDGTLYKDLVQTLLNGKSDNGHGHAIAEITNLQTTLNGKASSSHNHSSAIKYGYYQSTDATYTFASMGVGEIRLFNIYLTNTSKNNTRYLYLKAPSGGTYAFSTTTGDLNASFSGGTTFLTRTVYTDELNGAIGILVRKS